MTSTIRLGVDRGGFPKYPKGDITGIEKFVSRAIILRSTTRDSNLDEKK